MDLTANWIQHKNESANSKSHQNKALKLKYWEHKIWKEKGGEKEKGMREGERKKRKGKEEGKACNLRSNDLTYLQLKKENILAMELCNPPVCSHFRSLKIICLELRKSQSHSLTCFSIFLKGVHLSETILDQLTQNSHCLLYESWNFFSPMCFIFFLAPIINKL